MLFCRKIKQLDRDMQQLHFFLPDGIPKIKEATIRWQPP